MHEELLQISEELVVKGYQYGQTLTLAESCTGGMISSYLTAIPGSSRFFDSCFVTYSNISKIKLLDVSPVSLSKYGAVSEEVVIEMLDGLFKRSKANLALSISGIAGPGNSDSNKREGSVWIALAKRDQPKITKQFNYGPIGRDLVRKKSTLDSIQQLISLIY